MKLLNMIIGVLIIALFFSCRTRIPLSVESHEENLPNKSNRKYFLFFGLYFNDSIKIVYQKNTFLNEFVETDTHLGVSKTKCLLEPIQENENLKVIIGNRSYFLKPKKAYSYYYFEKVNDKISVTATNNLRYYH